MAALFISISLDVSFESVGSYFPRVILIGSISVEVPVAPEVGAAAVASPARVLELDTHALSEDDPSKSSSPPVSVAPMVLPFLCSDDSEQILRYPRGMIRRRRAILIRPGEEIPISRLYRTHPGGPCRALTVRNLIRPLPFHRLALRYTSHHLDHFTSGSSASHSFSDHSSSRHSISGHSLSGHTPPDTTDADSSTLLRFVHPLLARTPRCSKAYFRWRSTPLSTMSPSATVTSPIHATRALVPSHADLLPPHKRFSDSISPEDSVKEDINTDVLEDIEADVTAVKVVVDRDVEARINACIDIEVDVGVDVEGEVEDEVEVESSDRGTMEVGVDLITGIDIPDAMIMPDTVEHLEIEDIETGQRELKARSLIAGGERAGLPEQKMTITRSGMTPEAIEEHVNRRVEEALAAYEVTRAVNALEAESQSQNGCDDDNGNGGNGNGGNGNGGNGNPNENNRDVGHVARKCTYQDFMKCQPLSFKGTEGVVGLIRWFEKIETVFHISNCPKYQVKELMKLMAEVYCPRTEIQKMESDLWNLTMKNNDLAIYTQRFQELTMMCTKMVPDEEDRVEKFIGGLYDNNQGNVIVAEPTRLQDAVRIANNLMDQKLKGCANEKC
ncbi:putative reverse transcriptase domain-containing protein [Tanacetum coccineum]